ncbi:MAG: RNA polymerase sigma factor [Dehalococcoidia bacterium]
MQVNQSEAHLIERAREGELDAFNLLVERYERPLYNLCLRMLSSPQAAEDATQEAFISAYRSVKSFRGGSFKSWLFRIGANACYDELRRQRSRPSRSLDEPAGDNERTIDVPDTAPTPDESAENLELRDALGGAISGLPPDQRLTIILRDVQGLEYEEIAVATNTNLGTVKSRINRARSRLREALLAKRELLPSRLRQS